MGKRSGLVLDVKLGEFLSIGDVAKVELVQKSGQAARLRITAPADVLVRLHKGEVASDELDGHEMWESV